jgi:opacity protein-like surface antigen
MELSLMVKNNSRLFIFLALLLSKNVIAEWYVGGVYSYAMVDVPGGLFAAPPPLPPEPVPAEDEFLNELGSEEFTPSALIVKAGYELLPFVAVEFRLGTGITSGTRESFDIKREVDVGALYGGYLKLQTGHKEFNPYIMVGYTSLELDITGPVVSGNGDDDDISYGIGVEAALSDRLYFNLEYMQYFDKDDITGRAIGIGLVAKY